MRRDRSCGRPEACRRRPALAPAHRNPLASRAPSRQPTRARAGQRGRRCEPVSWDSTMRRRQFTPALATLLMARTACLALLAEAGNALALDETQATSGVRAALERGADSAVSLLGKRGGFLDNPQVRIPLPGVLNSAAAMLRMIGQQQRVDDLVNSMNRAAETAV